MFRVYPLIRQYLSGTTASGLYEARLERGEMGGQTHVFCPAYTAAEMEELCRICDHISFNSLFQLELHRPVWQQAGVSTGLQVLILSIQRRKAMQSTIPVRRGPVWASCAGICRSICLQGVEGIHFHTLCEQGAEPLAETVAAVEVAGQLAA